VNIIITVCAALAGWLNANAWGSAVVLVLLPIGAVEERPEGEIDVKRSATNSF
jgi:hypothetical protein